MEYDILKDELLAKIFDKLMVEFASSLEDANRILDITIEIEKYATLHFVLDKLKRRITQ